MISIIVATYRPELLKNLEKSIQDTIGVDYEIISIINRNEKGICEIYNIGIDKANYDIICFIHEDVIMRTQNWGILVNNIFQSNHDIGLIGVAGGSYKTVVPTHWSFVGANSQTIHKNIIQHDGNNNYVDTANPTCEALANVVSIDGVWMCTLKRVVEECKFDDILLKGFHGYDVDFSINVSQKYNVVVTYNILLEHLSNGNFDKKWIDETINVHKKWQYVLPINKSKLTYKEQQFEEIKALNVLRDKMVNNNYFNNNFIKLILTSRIAKLVGLKHVLKLVIKLTVLNLKSLVKNNAFLMKS